MSNLHLPIGTTLSGGRYRIVRFINAGGFGCTYEAVHTILGKRVAIKEFFPKELCNRNTTTSQISVGVESKMCVVKDLLRKFKKEAVVLNKFSHPNIVRVTDIFDENSTSYYVMDYIEGISIADIIKNHGTLSETRARHYIGQIADALSYVHKQNHLHLDVKPANIMVDKNDNAILIDFGAAKHYDEESGEATSVLQGIYSKGYAPYEQVSKSVNKFTPATDIYSLGATAYKMLTGQTPPDALLLRLGDTTLAPLPHNISLALRNAIEKAMQGKVENRPQNINSFLQILNANPIGGNEETKVDQDYEDDAVEEIDLYESESSPWQKILIAVVALTAVVLIYFWYSSNNTDANLSQQAENIEIAPGDSAVLEATQTELHLTQPAKENTYTEDATSKEKPAAPAVKSDEGLQKDTPQPQKPEDNPTPIIKEEPSSRPTPVTNNDNKVFDVVEQMPAFPGGQQGLMQWLSQNVRYPVVAQENGVQGRVIVGFVIGKDGTVRDVHVLRGVDPSLDREAIRVVKAMPKWIPGMQNDEPVNVSYNVPVTFRLQ